MSTEQKLMFKPVVETMFLHALSDRMTPAFRARLAELGFNLDKLLPGYDYSLWERALLEAAITLFPELDKKAALQELGVRMVTATVDLSPLSKSLMPLLKLLGVSRAIKRSLARSSSENFNVTTFGAETPTSIEVNMSYVGTIPEFAQGTLVGLIPLIGGTNVRVKMLSCVNCAATYLIEWS